MKASLFLASLFAAATMANPVVKRAQQTEWVVVVKTITKYGTGAPAPTFNANNAGLSASATVTATTNAAPSSTTTSSSVAVATPTSSSTSSSGTTSGSTSGGGSSSYSQAIIDAHNLERAKHGVSGLVWDNNMASIAQQIASSCVYAHNTAAGGGGYGQNIGAGALPADIPSMIEVEMYDDEIVYYPGYGSEPNMATFEKWGHFTQIVWKSTVSVGCYTQYCPSGLANVGGDVSPYFTVCNYSPPGNYAGEFTANVLAPVS